MPGDRAISPAVGVALLIVIVVAMAAVLGGMLLSLGETTPSTPKYATFQTDYVADGAGNTGDRPYVNITYDGGERLSGASVFVVDTAGHEVAWEAVWTASRDVEIGDSVHIDGFGSDGTLDPACQGERYRLVWRDGEGGEQTLSEHEITRPATGPAAVHC